LIDTSRVVVSRNGHGRLRSSFGRSRCGPEMMRSRTPVKRFTFTSR